MSDPATTRKILSNKYWTKTVQKFSRRIGHKLPLFSYDGSGSKRVLPENVGRYFASHAEKQLAVFFLVKTLKETYGRVRFKDMQKLATRKTPRAYILLGHERACENCLQFLRKVKELSGLDITAVPCETKQPYKRPQQLPYRQKAEAEHNSEQGDDNERELEVETDAPKRDSRPTKKVDVVPAADPIRGEGGAPQGWRNEKPLPPTPVLEWDVAAESEPEPSGQPQYPAVASPRAAVSKGGPDIDAAAEKQRSTNAPPRRPGPPPRNTAQAPSRRAVRPDKKRAPAKRRVRVPVYKPWTSMWQTQVKRRDEMQTGVPASRPETSFPDLAGFKYSEKTKRG